MCIHICIIESVVIDSIVMKFNIETIFLKFSITMTFRLLHAKTIFFKNEFDILLRITDLFVMISLVVSTMSLAEVQYLHSFKAKESFGIQQPIYLDYTNRYSNNDNTLLLTNIPR